MSSTPNQKPARDDAPSWYSASWMLAAIVVGACLVGAIYLFATRPTQPHAAPAASSATATQAASGTTGGSATGPGSASASGTCPQRSVTPGANIAVAPAATWAVVDQQTVPRTEAGPGSTVGYPHCFAPTIVGALTAAANYYPLAFGQSPTAEAVRQSAWQGLPSNAASKMAAMTGAVVRTMGYKILTPLGADNTVHLELREHVAYAGSEEDTGIPLTMHWNGNDWELMFTNDQMDRNLYGFTSWAA